MTPLLGAPRGAVCLLVCALSLLTGCRSAAEIRVENVSERAYSDIRVGGVPFGDLAPGARTEYQRVGLRLGYAAIEMGVGGRVVTGQTLNMGARRFTYRIGIADLEAGHLAIEVVRE